MIVIDIFIVAFALALLIVGGPTVVKKLLSMNPKRKEIEAATVLDEQGEVNTVRFNLAQLRNCAYCHQPTNPAKDLRTIASWVHADCYLKTLDLDKDKGKHNA